MGREPAGTLPNIQRFAKRMTEEAEGRYFARRERCERALSRRAASSRAAAAHGELAERYEALALVFGAKNCPEGAGNSDSNSLSGRFSS